MKWKPDFSKNDFEKCLSHVRIFDGSNCISDMFKRMRKSKKTYFIDFNGMDFILEHNFEKMHNESGLHSFIVSNNLPSHCKLVKLLKGGECIVSLKIHNSDIKGKPQNITFTCIKTHLTSFFEILGQTFGLQK